MLVLVLCCVIYAPLPRTPSEQIPDEVLGHIMKTAGCDIADERLKRTVALAGEKFLFDVAQSAREHHKFRKTQDAAAGQEGQGARGGVASQVVLEMEDVLKALKDQGIPLYKPAYYVNSLASGSR